MEYCEVKLSKGAEKLTALETLSNYSNNNHDQLFNFVIYDTISASCTTPYYNCSYQQAVGADSSETTTTCNTTAFSLENNINTTTTTTSLKLPHRQDHDHYQNHDQGDHQVGCRKRQPLPEAVAEAGDHRRQNNVSRKKRRRKPRVCKNKEEAETQRMTHIAVERNRRKQMNEHLAVLRSLMPESYVQRGDQASVVGGAIEFVKELEHLLQSLEAQKLQVLQGINNNGGSDHDYQDNTTNTSHHNTTIGSSKLLVPPPFAQFFVYPQYTWSQVSSKYTSKTKAAIADIEVTLIETHASLRILSRRSPKQLSKLIAGFQTLHLTVLHLNVTTMNPLVLYSVSVKVEEACLLTSVDDIAAAVHHMLRIIEEEAALC